MDFVDDVPPAYIERAIGMIRERDGRSHHHVVRVLEQRVEARHAIIAMLDNLSADPQQLEPIIVRLDNNEEEEIPIIGWRGAIRGAVDLLTRMERAHIAEMVERHFRNQPADVAPPFGLNVSVLFAELAWGARRSIMEECCSACGLLLARPGDRNRENQRMIARMTRMVHWFDGFDYDSEEETEELLRCAACVYAAKYRENFNFLVRLFSPHEMNRFKEWRPTEKVVAEGKFGCLLFYPPFRELCNTVDPKTRLYPLQKAIQMGLKWNEGVQQVAKAGDEIIGFSDPEEGLVPFQLAASNEKASLDLTYNLLKAGPQLLFYRILDPKTMIYNADFFSGYVQREGVTEPEAIINWENVEYDYSSDDEDCDCDDNNNDDDECCGEQSE